MPRDTQTDKRYSVCIGINSYAPETGLEPLSCAENDARDMDEMLGKLGFDAENRILLLGEAATLDAINAALGDIIVNRAKENDLVVVYFAGHSTPVTFEDHSENRKSEVFLAPTDFHRQRLTHNRFFRQQYALGMERVRQVFFEGPGSRKRLFIFDSCYSGDFYGPAYRDGAEQVPGYIQEKMNSGTEGRIFLASCLPYEKAKESVIDGHGQFTLHLLRALNGEDLDALCMRDGVLTLTASSLFDYLSGKLRDQKPVKGGVEFGSFILARYPHRAKTDTHFRGDEDRVAEETQLNEMWIDQRDIVRDLLERFVGREGELAGLEEQIASQMEHGGYISITGDVGQGKSSIIAKLIEKQGLDTTAYHFIPPNAGREHQMLLLRSLMARLLLKYGLPARYAAGESYTILYGYFSRLLKEISTKQAREAIYIDGLDQLAIDASARPDLSFLPDHLPPGIVIVIGTRPNETFEQLRLLPGVKVPYSLPGLSHKDFNLLLQRHSVTLPSALRSLLSEKLKHNPLYLGLVAQELEAQPELRSEAVIARIANNPDNIFGLTFSRLQQVSDWHEVARPMLGTLLVAQEPLSRSQIAHILEKEEVRVRTAATRLGGLLARSGQQKYTLFHSKLRDYLGPEGDPDNDIQFSQEERERLHGNIARWCEQESLEQIWEPIPAPTSSDDYQEYARKHYITHLYNSGNYQRLFDVLNAGTYEREKLRFDQSTRSSAADLLLGCKAAARLARTTEDGRNLLLSLWRYTLLRTSLTTRADAYPIEAFHALLELGKEQEASGLIELLTQAERKLAALILMTRYLLTRSARVSEGLQLYNRTYEIATTLADSAIKTRALRDLATVLVESGQLAQAEEVACELQTNLQVAETLVEVSGAYGAQHNWQKAEEIARAIDNDEQLIRVLSNLAAHCHIAHDKDKANQLWQEVETKIAVLTDSEKRNKALSYLATSFLQAQEWFRADEIIRHLSGLEKITLLSQFVLALIQAGLSEQADTVWDTIRETINDIEESDEHDRAQARYAIAYAEAGFLENAEKEARKIRHPANSVAAYRAIASCSLEKGLWKQDQPAMRFITRQYSYSDVEAPALDAILIDLIVQLAQARQWESAKEIALTLPRKEAQARALIRIAIEQAKAGVRDAESTWNDAKAMCVAQTSDVQISVASVLVTALVEAGQIECAEAIITKLPDEQAKESVREKLALALARTGQIAGAVKWVGQITNIQAKMNVTRSIAIAQMKAEFTEEARKTASDISDVETSSQTLNELVSLSCQAQQWDIAEDIARQIPSSPVQGEAQKRIVIELARARKATDARRIANSIRSEFYKANALCDLATTLAQMYPGKGEAEKVARAIRNDRIKRKAYCNISLASMFGATMAESDAFGIEASDEREDALCSVASVYAQDHSWDDAKRIVEAMSNEGKRDKVWGIIAREYASAGQWEQALSSFDKIRTVHQRKAVLQAWGALLARSKNTALSEQIASHLDQSAEKASLLVSMANSLAEAGHNLELIHLIQRSWLQAGTKDDCQHLFAMVHGVILRNPEICDDFYKAFEWAGIFVE